jgi:hypothetical protein
VDAQAIFVTSANTLTITLNDLLANPKTVAQLLSDLSFTVDSSSCLTGTTLTSSSGQEVKVAGDGVPTLGSTVAAGWVPTLGGTSGLLDVLKGPGHAGPAHLIIGSPDGSGNYSNANSSIAGNGPHNPFLNQSATFTITGAGITADTVVTSATFSFGTTSGNNVPGVVVPEPSSLVVSVGSLGVFALIALWRAKRNRQAVAA